jgi:hypothetical protein
MSRTVVALVVVGALVSLPADAVAVRPIAGGHYILDTPQTDPEAFGYGDIESRFGSFLMHVFRRGDRFAKYAFVRVDAPCSPGSTGWALGSASLDWWFDLDERTGQAPLKIQRDGSFAGRRRGILRGGSLRRGREPPDSPHAGYLTISGRFVTRRRAIGRLMVTSADGCRPTFPLRAYTADAPGEMCSSICTYRHRRADAGTT